MHHEIRDHGDQLALPAVFMRGGASKAVVFKRRDLPDDCAHWDALFLSLMGSPDPYGRQLDGMGGGNSSLSKVCIIDKPSRPDADIDYTFGQVEIGAARVDYKGSCGSMATAMGPFAVDEGLVAAPAEGEATVRIHDVNARKIIVSRFPVRHGKAAVAGDIAMDGVAGTGAPVSLDFLDPGGAATGLLLPTGAVTDEINVEGLGTVAFSFVDASNPVMFVEAASMGMHGTELPAEIESTPGLLERIDLLRRSVTVKVGAATDLEAARAVSLPRIAFVAAPRDSETLSGSRLQASDLDILVRMIGRGKPHRAVPVTTALCLAVACRLPGTLPRRLLSESAARSAIRIGHPSGTWSVDAEVEENQGTWHARSATATMTARRLFEGHVLVPRR